MKRKPSVRVLLFIAGIWSASCTSAISTTQSAETLRTGQAQVSIANNVAIPASRVIAAYDQAKSVARKLADDVNYKPTEQDKQDYLGAAIGLALSPPGVAADFMIRYGVADHLDAGLRYSTSGIHVDLKYQFLDAAGWHGAVSLGVRHHMFSGLIFDLLEYIDIKDFSRNDVEIPLLVGRSFGHRGLRKLRNATSNSANSLLSGRYWFGPKFIASKTTIDANLMRFDTSLTISDTFTYVGGVAGGSIGLRGLELFAEITAMHLNANVNVLGQQRQLGGVVVMPSIGLQAAF
jgi:hypothetical protein